MSEPNNVCEEKIFEGLFRKLSKSIRDFLYYQSGDLARSEDLVQDIFFTLWEKCKDVPLSKAKSYLFTLARNRFLNEAEKQKVRLKYRDQSRSGKDVKDPDYMLRMKEHEERLNAALNQLSEGQREVFLLNRINKMTYAEIAESLGVSQKAIEKRMSKALQKLKEVLNPEE